MISYKSKFEKQVAKELLKLKAKAKYEPFSLEYIIESSYTPDWVLPNGVILEAKGKLDYETRRKMVAVKKAHPELDIRFVFMNAFNKIQKHSKTTYGEWANKNGFLWCEVIPKEWLL